MANLFLVEEKGSDVLASLNAKDNANGLILSLRERVISVQNLLVTNSPINLVLPNLEEAEDLLSQIARETKRYSGNLLSAPSPPLNRVKMSSQVETVTQAYTTIEAASTAVANVDINELSSVRILSLINALEGLKDANDFLEDDLARCIELLNIYPTALDDLATLAEDTENKIEEVEDEIEYLVSTTIKTTVLSTIATTTKDQMLLDLETTLELLDKIVNETDRYINNLPSSTHLLSSTSLDPAPQLFDQVDQAYQAIGNASEAVESVDVDSVNSDTIDSLSVAYLGLLDANDLLETKLGRSALLLLRHDAVEDELRMLRNNSTKKSEEVEDKIGTFQISSPPPPPPPFTVETIKGLKDAKFREDIQKNRGYLHDNAEDELGGLQENPIERAREAQDEINHLNKGPSSQATVDSLQSFHSLVLRTTDISLTLSPTYADLVTLQDLNESWDNAYIFLDVLGVFAELFDQYPDTLGETALLIEILSSKVLEINESFNDADPITVPPKDKNKSNLNDDHDFIVAMTITSSVALGFSAAVMVAVFAVFYRIGLRNKENHSKPSELPLAGIHAFSNRE